MKIGPKFKIARRLGAPIFEKTQTQKYAQSLARKEKTSRPSRRPRSEFGLQLIEKQKARLTYGLGERQFSRYVKEAFSSKEPTQKLFRTLELRLDNVLYRGGFAKSRLQARQISAHGHATVNGRRVTIPSIMLREGDRVGIRSGSTESALFTDTAEKMRASSAPAWLAVEADKREAEITGLPQYVPAESNFDLGVVLEFYSR